MQYKVLFNVSVWLPKGRRHDARIRQIAMQNHQPDFSSSVERTARKKLTLGKNGIGF